LYTHYVHLEHVFQFFDKDNNSIITESEFISQCETLNALLPLEGRIPMTDTEAVFKLMDVKECGEVDINLFFEMFRLADDFGSISDKLYAYQATRKIELDLNGGGKSILYKMLLFIWII
jgi:hypothetical protein